MSQVDQAGWDLQDKGRSEVQAPDFLTGATLPVDGAMTVP